MSHYFYDTIYRLRTNEELTIFEKLITFQEGDVNLVKDFLKIEFDNEAFNINCTSLAFNSDAAIWGAKTIYTASQLILFRENKEEELPSFFEPFEGDTNFNAIFSIDLCLRFLPQIIQETKYIDPDDKLIDILELILTKWHYSGIGYELNVEELNTTIIKENIFLEKLYVERIIEKKDIAKLKIPFLKDSIKATLGIYTDQYWKEIKSENG